MTVPLYPQIIYKGDLSPAAAGSVVDQKIKDINEACKGFGTDEIRLIKVLGNCSLRQRALIAAKYEDVYGKDLKTVMKKECGKGDFGIALQLLSVPADEAECDIIKLACKGAGTDELSLYPIICGRTNKEIDLLKKKFYKVCISRLPKFCLIACRFSSLFSKLPKFFHYA
jgi:annexin A7/11